MLQIALMTLGAHVQEIPRILGMLWTPRATTPLPSFGLRPRQFKSDAGSVVRDGFRSELRPQRLRRGLKQTRVSGPGCNEL